MKLHTSLSRQEVCQALADTKKKERMTHDVEFVQFEEEKSRSRPNGYKIQLGTYRKNSLPPGYTDQDGKHLRVRRYKNSGEYGTSRVYAATWHEWGWFITEIFDRDPEASFGDYKGPDNFHSKTGYKFA